MRKVRCKITYGKSNINFVIRKSSFKGDEDIEKGAPKGGSGKIRRGGSKNLYTLDPKGAGGS